MKALKFALATCLALGFVAVGVLWWDLNRDHVENKADAAVAASARPNTPDDDQGTEAWKAPPLPPAALSLHSRRADFRAAKPVIDDGKPLPASPFAAPAWDERIPAHTTRIDKGLFVEPLPPQ